MSKALSSKAQNFTTKGRSSDLFNTDKPSHRTFRQWQKRYRYLYMNSQQRDCLGFSPNSLLISA